MAKTHQFAVDASAPTAYRVATAKNILNSLLRLSSDSDKFTPVLLKRV